MQVSRSAYYRWSSKGHHPKPQDAMLEARLKALFEDSKNTYGSRRLAKELTAQGFPVGRYKVRRIMEKLQLTVCYPKRFKLTTDSRHGFELSPNLLNRQFKMAAPNQAWTTDISYVWTLEGWVYIAVVMDLYSRQIIGWAVDDHMRTALCSSSADGVWAEKTISGITASLRPG
ncbi:hypothetical protein B1207_11590 [Legionella quinlivanii]|uniref:Integrase catalytic domain-containing protein n=1 Tax=Legionella quinlivanii TaxID=45073 RepID=A0A364LHX8_9GAMM|nr:hypothetical protein B1207_11590 [Legionella quinlivanii]